MTKLFPAVPRRRAVPIVAFGAALALVLGLMSAGGAGASVPPVSVSSQVCNPADDSVTVTLGSTKSWWNFEITTNRPGVSIDTDTASNTLTFTLPRSQVPVTLSIRYHEDNTHVKTITIDEPSCVESPVTPTTTNAPTTTTPVVPVPTTVVTPGPTSTVPAGTGPTTTVPVQVESKTTTKPTSTGAVPVKVATINYAG